VAIFPLVHTQLVPPRIKNHIKREDLTEIGLSILSHRITAVVAPAGYGKSTWVASLLEEKDWPLTAWLSLDRHDNEPSYFLYHLIHAIKRVLPEFGAQSLRTMNSLEDAGCDWLIVISSIIEEMPREKKFVLVLDDLYLVDKSATICEILAYLSCWMPVDVSLVLISRNSLPLNLSREYASGELLDIQGGVLLFTVDETREMLQLLGLNMDSEDVETIHLSTEGWVVGLRLFGTYLQRTGGDIKNTLLDLKQKDINLHSYLSNELLDHLPKELNDFLLDVSLLPYLEPDLCNAALQINDSDAKIKQLHSHGLISRIECETITWRLHHLMGEFLEQKTNQLHDLEHIKSVRRRSAVFLESKNDIDGALGLLVACDDWLSIARRIREHGDRYFLQNGRQDSLSVWIERLPENYVVSDHRLLYLKGMGLLHVDSENALECLSSSVDLAEQQGNIRGQVRSLMAMLGVYALENNTENLKKIANRIPIAASLLKDSWSRGVVLVAALGKAVSDDHLKRGVWLSRLAGKMHLDPEWHTYYLILSAIIQYRLGNMSQAKDFVDKALALPYVRESDRWTGTVYEVLSGIYCDSGDSRKTVEISRELLRLGEKYKIPHQEAYGHRRLARVYLREGDIDEARREYELSRRSWFEANNTSMAYIIDMEIILVRSIAGDDPKTLLEEVKKPLNKILSNPFGQGYEDYALSLAGVIAREAGELAQAQLWLEKSSANSAAKGAKQLFAGTLIHLAGLYLLKGEESKADSVLRKALGIVEAAKLDLFWDWYPETVYSLCKRAILKNIHPVWAMHILKRWFPQRVRKEAGIMLAHPDGNVRKLISELLQDGVQSTGVQVIHVNCLGDFRVFLNGNEISPSAWKTKKVENLFKFLIVNKGQQLKEKVIETLWPKSDAKSGDASLRMALTHLRKTIELAGDAGESVILKRGMIYLNPKLEIITDYELFDAVAQSVLGNSAGDIPATLEPLEYATELYGSGFLLENVYDDWAASTRTRLHQLYLQVLARQVEICFKQGKTTSALQACRSYLAVEPADERMNRKAMELLWQGGQRLQALSLYQDLVAVLAKEYGVSPSMETNTLYEAIRCN
jgi:ATP/maltotriose-dependent transcriptional regulator MalT/two-component SAPR family response regulator